MASVHCYTTRCTFDVRTLLVRNSPSCKSHAAANKSSSGRRKVAAGVSKAQLNALNTDVKAKNQRQLSTARVKAEETVERGESLQTIVSEQGLQQLLQSGPACIALGAFVCSFISLQIKLFDHPLPPLEVSAVCSGAAWAATSIILQVRGLSSTSIITNRTYDSSSSSSSNLHTAVPVVPSDGSNTSSSIFLLLLLRGTLAAVAVTCYYSAIEELPLPVAVALFFFHPIFAVVFDVAVTGRRIPPVAAASCILTVIGVLIIGWHDQLLEHLQELTHFVATGLGLQTSSSSSALVAAELPLGGVLTGLAAAAANAAAFVTVNVIGPGVSPWRLTYWQHLVVTHAAVGLLALEALEEDFVELQQESPALSSAAEWLQAAAEKMFVLVSDGLPDRHDALLLLGILVANFLGQVLLSAGFQRLDAGRGSAVNTSQVLFGCVWDVTLLHAAPSMAMAAGAMAIGAGVYGSTVMSGNDGDESSLDSGRDLAGRGQ